MMFMPLSGRRAVGSGPKSAALSLAATSVCLSLGLASPTWAVDYTVTKTVDTVIDTRGLTLDSTVAAYGIGINGNSFENSAIQTYNGWQYTAYWVKDGTSYYVALARRQTGTTAWQVANLPTSTLTNGLSGGKPSDAHNVVSFGIDKTNGTIHLAYDLHGHTLKYRVSQTGIATNPNSITAANWAAGTTNGTTSLFNAQTGQLVSGTTVNTVTYPHFFNTPTGALQFTYRTGSSGNGSNWIGTYNGATQTWGNVHQYDNGAIGGYTGTVTVNDTNRNSYINGMTYGPTGRLYQSFTWREGATGAANHDIAFVYSDDNGSTWKNNAGTTVGTTAANNTGIKWTVNTPGLTVIPLDENQSLMNQQTQAVTSDDKFHTMMWHRDSSKPNTGGVYAPTESSYFDYWRDGNGNWHRSKLPGQVGSRPKLFFDANDNAIAIYQLGSFSSGGIYINNGDLVIAAATKASNWTDWKVIKTETGPFVSEAQADASLLALNGTLSVTMQNSPTSTTPAQATNMRALDYTINVTPATDHIFTALNGNWGNTASWSTGQVPSVNDNAVINNGRIATINTGVGTLDGSLIIGSGGSAGTLNLQNTGNINVLYNVIVGRDGGASGTYFQNSGTLASNRFVVGDYFNETSSGGVSTATLSNATLSTGELVISAGGASTSGSSFTIGGNSVVTVNGEVLLGDLGSTATLTLNGGLLTVNGDIREGFNGNNTSLVRVNGGTLNATANAIRADTVELNGGTIQNALSFNTLNGTGGTITRTDSATTTLTINDGNTAASIQNGTGTGIVSLNKVTDGTLILSGASNYSGATTITGGVIRAQNNTALGNTTGNTTIGSTASLRLELAGNITIAEPLVFGGRQPGVTDAHLANVSGTNTLTGSINTAVGGNQYNVRSDAGKLIVTGSFINNGTGGATDIRTLNLSGAGDGEWRSNLTNGTSAVTAVTKSGTGTWTFTGSNTYTGVTTVSAGTLRATNPAFTALLSNAGGVDLGDGILVLDYTGGTSPAANVKSLLTSAKASNFASGQIRSTTLVAGETIGYRDAGSAVTIRVTLPGDADLNGTVDFNDFLALQAGFGNTGTRFDQGDFDYNGVTDFNDFLALQANFGTSLSGDTVAVTASEVAALTAFSQTAAVPEPTTLAAIGLTTGAMLRRRQRAITSTRPAATQYQSCVFLYRGRRKPLR